MGWRLESLARLLFYLAAAVLLVVLPLHLLEHVPWSSVRRTPEPVVLYLLLVAAGFHGMIGLRSLLYDYVRGRAGRLLVDLLSLALMVFVVGVGLAGLLRVYPLP